MDKKLAIIEVGGKQHLVSVGDKVVSNRTLDEQGSTLKLKDMLNGLEVELSVIEHGKGEKVKGLKFKNKTKYLRRYGHRQSISTFEVIAVGEDKKTTKSATKKTTEVVKETAKAEKAPKVAKTTKTETKSEPKTKTVKKAVADKPVKTAKVAKPAKTTKAKKESK